jgi:3-oxoacyl-[acyl-carrier protein] reductase
VAFVTGAGIGIGRATAPAFARHGVGVVVADVAEQDNQRTAGMIEQAGRRGPGQGDRPGARRPDGHT